MTLTPQADQRAADLGAVAGAGRMADGIFDPCPWSLSDELPRGRWAVRWWQAFDKVAGSTLPQPE